MAVSRSDKMTHCPRPIEIESCDLNRTLMMRHLVSAAPNRSGWATHRIATTKKTRSGKLPLRVFSFFDLELSGYSNFVSTFRFLTGYQFAIRSARRATTFGLSAATFFSSAGSASRSKNCGRFSVRGCVD
jgi:hypothetical protein